MCICTHIHHAHTYDVFLDFWYVPIYKLRPSASEHSLLKPHAMSNCIYQFIFSHLGIYLPEISFCMWYEQRESGFTSPLPPHIKHIHRNT